MAQTIPNPINLILTNRTAISNVLQAIRRHTTDGTRVLNPENLGWQLDNITDRLERILRNTIQLQNECEQYQNTLDEENRRVEDLRNQLRDARNQYTNAYWG